jgi:hypothetical protein
MNTVLTRVMETDFISPGQRREILEKLTPVIVKTEKEPLEEEVAHTASAVAETRSRLLIATAAMGVLASLVGALLAVAPRLQSIRLTSNSALIAVGITAGISLALIGLFLVVSRFREEQAEPAGIAGYKGTPHSNELLRGLSGGPV